MILVLELVDKMLSVMSLITFQFAVAQRKCQETHLFSADQFKVSIYVWLIDFLYSNYIMYVCLYI